LAQVSLRRPRSDAACALLRPSASASAKFANSTVNHSHTVMASTKPGFMPVSPGKLSACTQSSVVRMLPMYTMNITGLRHWVRGFSLAKAPHRAGLTSAASNSERDVFCI
jgi:hypothetical protein